MIRPAGVSERLGGADKKVIAVENMVNAYHWRDNGDLLVTRAVGRERKTKTPTRFPMCVGQVLVDASIILGLFGGVEIAAHNQRGLGCRDIFSERGDLLVLFRPAQWLVELALAARLAATNSAFRFALRLNASLFEPTGTHDIS